jgi:hypothetical protein
MFSALHEPSEFGVREALRILFGLKGEDGLVVIDGHNDSVRYCPCRILPRCYFKLKDTRSPVLSAKHATDMEAEGASSSPLKIQTETPPGAGPVFTRRHGARAAKLTVAITTARDR